jgi:15-cis-phytoene synthase
VCGSAGGVAVAAGRLLDAPDPEALRPLGTAYGIAGLLRSIPAHSRQGRCLLPVDVLTEHGLAPEVVIADPSATAAYPVMRQLAHQGLMLLQRLPVPRQAIAAILPAVLARRDLRRAPALPIQRGIGDRLAVMFAGLAGRV